MPSVRRHPQPLTWLLLLIVGLLALWPTGAPARPAAAAPTLAAALKSGRAFVLVVAPQPTGAVAGSEAYGDWQSYLQEFERRKPRGIPVVTITPARYARNFARPVLTAASGTLFVRDRRRALLHRDLILDPFLYDCGVRYLRRQPSCAEAANYGMPEVSLRRR